MWVQCPSFLAVADLSTQMLLVLLGALLLFHPDRLATDVHFGVAPSFALPRPAPDSSTWPPRPSWTTSR